MAAHPGTLAGNLARSPGRGGGRGGVDHGPEFAHRRGTRAHCDRGTLAARCRAIMKSESFLVDALELSPERRAILAPKLEQLLVDFSHLQEFDRPDLQPVSTEWLVRSSSRDAG